jgi:transposase
MWTAEDRERYRDDGRRYPSDLTDAEWELVRSLFETYPTLTKDIRAMVDGCLYPGAEGCRWRSLPKDFGPWQTVRGYWDRFRRDGVWADVAALLTPAARARLGKAPALSTGIADSQSVTSGPQKGERGVDGNKKVKGIKRHLLTCSLGFVLAVLVSAANLHDTHGLDPLLAPGGRGRVGPAADQGRRDLRRPGGRGGGRAARRRGPGRAPRPGRPGLRALAGPVADRGHVRHAHEPLPPPDQEPRAERRGGRERRRAGQSQACPARLDPSRSKFRLMKQAPKEVGFALPAFALPAPP